MPTTYGNTPYGLRQLRFVISGTVYELPIAQSAEFEPTYESAQLKGDDVLQVSIATLIGGKITVKAGGLPLEVWAALTGATKTTTNAGLSNEITTLTLVGGENTVPAKLYAKMQGPNGDNTHVYFYKVTLDSSKLGTSGANFASYDATFSAVPDVTSGKLLEIKEFKTSTVLPTS